MSMLAERKQKQKWTLNPRGKYWSDDANKFGQRMLEKMGWSSGKGLGANLDGRTEHIKQSYKNDSKGIGFADKGDQWTKHEVDFSSLLDNLGEKTDTSIKKPEISLEKKSQSSRVRVHYHKFTRGKDLSRYSEKDLANVFGRKTLEKKSPDEKPEEKTSTDDKEFGVMTVNGGNMAEYFKNKYKTLMKPTEIEDDYRPSFGLGYDSIDVKTDEITTQNEPETVQPEKKKKKRTKVVINECFDNPGFADFTDNPIEAENPEFETPRKKKKKSSKEDLAFDNPGLNIDFKEESTDLQPERVAKKKSKKRKLETISEEIPQIDEIEEIVPKKRKKVPVKPESDSKKVCAEVSEIENNTQEIPAKIKKKKSKKTNLGIDNPACTEISVEEIKEFSETKKSKKRKKGLDNLACTANSAQQNIEETIASMSNAIDNYQLELENQMNEKKARTKKAASPKVLKNNWLPADKFYNPKTSIKELYRQGKVRVHFEGSNLHTIAGYGVSR